MRFKFLFLALLFHGTFAYSFPEMIRHSYANCTSCHVSPNGGGVLNEYGRQSSQAALSTWGTEDEAKPFYNLFQQPYLVDTAAFARVVQTAKNNTKVSSGYFWWMQGELEAAVKLGKDSKWTLDLDVGLNPGVLNSLEIPGDSPVLARRFFAIYRPTEETSVRVGKFIADYGVYFAEHTISTRQGLGFDQGEETYNLEYGYQGENYSGSVTLNLGRPDHPNELNEKGGMATVAMYLSDQYKIGWSAYYGTQNGISRELTGPYALLGFTTKFYLMAELDLQLKQNSTGVNSQGFYSYERLGYELIQGLHLYVMEQSQIPTFASSASSRMYGFGPGLYWFPRPHFYIQLEVQEQISKEFPSNQTSGFLTGNIYL